MEDRRGTYEKQAGLWDDYQGYETLNDIEELTFWTQIDVAIRECKESDHFWSDYMIRSIEGLFSRLVETRNRYESALKSAETYRMFQKEHTDKQAAHIKQLKRERSEYLLRAREAEKKLAELGE